MPFVWCSVCDYFKDAEIVKQVGAEITYRCMECGFEWSESLSERCGI